MTFVSSAPSRPSSTETPRIGLLAWSSCDWPSFVQGLEKLGYKPGITIKIECRTAGGRHDGLAAAAAELVRLSVDVIVTTSQPGGHAAHKATGSIPIVTIVSGDPVAAGLAQNLSRPGGNLTGVSYYATELTAKRLELLKEIIPKIARVGLLANPDVSYLPFEEDAKRAARQFGIAVTVHQVREPTDLDTAFSRMKSEGVEAVFVLPDTLLADEATRIAALALEHRLPTMAWGGWFTEVGCLAAYSADYDDMNHRLAHYVDRILKGEKAGELPIEQPTMFELSINLKTAVALGIELPQYILLLADKVIE